MTTLTARHEHIAETPSGPLIAVAFGGTYAPGSAGNEFAREMVDYLRSTLNDVQPAAVLFDLTALDYVWGDAIAGLAMPLMEKDEPLRFLPSAMVATGPTALAIKPLLEPNILLGLAGMKLFDTRQQAVAYLQTVISSPEQYIRVREPEAPRRRDNKWPVVEARRLCEAEAPRRRDDEWPVVEAKLLCAVFPSEGGVDYGPAAALDYLSVVIWPLLLVWGLVRLARGHRVTFMYMYAVAGKNYSGYAHRYVRSTEDTPKLFGKAAGETIYVRYKAKNPAVSVVRAQDNLE